MVKTATQTQVVNLLDVANQLKTTAVSLQQKVKESGKPVAIPAKAVSKKVTELAQLPADLVLFRLRESVGVFECDTLCPFVDDDGNVTLFSPDLEPVTGFEFVSYTTGYSGNCIVRHESGLQLQTPISTNQAHIEKLVGDNKRGLEGTGSPLPEYLSPVPQPEIPLYNDDLPQNQALEVVKTGKTTRQFQTPMVDVKTQSGTIIKNLICNADLQRIVERYGVGAKFQIAGKRPRLNKEGLPINEFGKTEAEWKADKNKETWKPAQIVQIADLQGTDFSDLEI